MPFSSSAPASTPAPASSHLGARTVGVEQSVEVVARGTRCACGLAIEVEPTALPGRLDGVEAPRRP